MSPAPLLSPSCATCRAVSRQRSSHDRLHTWYIYHRHNHIQYYELDTVEWPSTCQQAALSSCPIFSKVGCIIFSQDPFSPSKPHLGCDDADGGPVAALLQPHERVHHHVTPTQQALEQVTPVPQRLSHGGNAHTGDRKRGTAGGRYSV